MTVKSKALVLTLLLGLLALPALADHHGPGGGPGTPGVGEGALTNPRFLVRYLNLSSTQVTQLQGFLKTLQTAVHAVQTAQAPLCQQLRTDVGATSPDPTTVGRDYLALIANQEKVKTALTAFDTSFSAILNADQLAKYDALKEAVGLGDGKITDLLPECPRPSSSS
jgi:hypothetical protein